MNKEPVVLVLWTPLRIQAQLVHEALRSVDGVQVIWADDEAHACASLAQADGAVLLGAGGGYTPAIAKAVQQSPRLRWVQIFSTGIDSLQAQGMPAHLTFSHIGDAGAAPVAEHAMALLLALVRQLPRAIAQRPDWNRNIATSMRSLEGMRLALLGCGAIGQGIAQRARAFGMTCVGVNRSGKNPDESLFEKVYPIEQRRTALEGCDAVAVSLPLSEETRALIGAEDWASCRRGAFVVSVGRGPVVQMQALCDALASGQVAAAGLDVTDPEPLPADHPLWQNPSVLITPHVAGAGSGAVVARLCGIVVDNTERFLRGEVPRLLLQQGRH